MGEDNTYLLTFVNMEYRHAIECYIIAYHRNYG